MTQDFLVKVEVKVEKKGLFINMWIIHVNLRMGLKIVNSRLSTMCQTVPQ